MIDFRQWKLECQNCGGTVFKTPDNPTESSRIICDACGHDAGSVGEFNAEALRQAKAAVPDLADAVRKALRDAGKH